MEFVQIIEYESDRPEDVEALAEQWWRMGRPRHGPHRVTIVRDRERPNRYLTIAEFASHEEAMQNSELPETGRFAVRLRELSRGEPQFLDLDVVRRHEV